MLPIHFPLTSISSLSPRNHSPSLHLNNFVISVIYKWNHTVRNILRLGIFTQPISLQIVAHINSQFFFLTAE